MHVPSETEAAVVYYFKINAVLRCCMLQVVRCEGQTVSEEKKTTNHIYLLTSVPGKTYTGVQINPNIQY